LSVESANLGRSLLKAVSGPLLASGIDFSPLACKFRLKRYELGSNFSAA